MKRAEAIAIAVGLAGVTATVVGVVVAHVDSVSNSRSDAVMHSDSTIGDRPAPKAPIAAATPTNAQPAVSQRVPAAIAPTLDLSQHDPDDSSDCTAAGANEAVTVNGQSYVGALIMDQCYCPSAGTNLNYRPSATIDYTAPAGFHSLSVAIGFSDQDLSSESAQFQVSVMGGASVTRKLSFGQFQSLSLPVLPGRRIEFKVTFLTYSPCREQDQAAWLQPILR